MGTTGAPLNLTWPAEGATDWDTNYVNVNWSIINSAIAALQAAGSTGPKGDTGATGAVGLIWAGIWNSGVSYVATNAVYFNGSSYIALAPNVNAEPDTHPSSWALLAAQGAQGAQGIQGPEGSGSSVAFPITLAEGGTGVAATTQAQARGGIGAAASGNNADITELTGIPNVTLGPNSLAMLNGINQSQLTAAMLTVASVLAPSSGGAPGTLFLGDGNQFVGVQCPLSVSQGMTLDGGAIVNTLLIQSAGATPTAGAGEVAFGSQTSPSATPGGGQVPPATVLGYLIGNVAGAIVKFPYYAP
jgi:hypothetical protein